MKRFTVNLRDGSVFVIDAEFVHDDPARDFMKFSVEDRPVAWVSRDDVLTIRVEPVVAS
ncbi:MAG TPA: hypothetical protein GX718_02080 [Brevibacterium sp.]|nr:hypothetical protein [Brevibacterium sp.]